MPRLKWPEARRTKATRSRCLGSILACTLNTNPATLVSSGAIWRGWAFWGCGSGPKSAIPCISSCTPKELIAEPNQMGVMVPSSRACLSSFGSNSLAISISSKNTANKSAGTCCASAGSFNPLILIVVEILLRSARSINSSLSRSMS